MLPHFFVVGAQKAGSTYLLQCLGEHPAVFMPPAEVPFFEDPLYAPERIGDFERHFDAAKPDQVVGVKRPNLLGLPECPYRLARHMPELKLVVTLRDPIERAISGYFHSMKTGLLPVAPLEEGMRQILTGEIAGYPRAPEVLTFGLYNWHLVNYQQHFPAARFFITLLDDIKRDAGAELARAYRFLGVDDGYRPAAAKRRPMEAIYSLRRLRLWNALDERCREWSPDRRHFTRHGASRRGA